MVQARLEIAAFLGRFSVLLIAGSILFSDIDPQSAMQLADLKAESREWGQWDSRAVIPWEWR